MINNNTILVREPTSGKPTMKSFRALQGILVALVPFLVLGVIAHRLGTGTMPSDVLITLAYALSIAAASVVLYRQGTGWRQIGLARPKSWPRTVLLAIATLVMLFLVINVVQWIALSQPGLATQPADVSRFNPLEGNLPLLLFYLLLAWTTITFGEEMFFRAFLISQLEIVFQNTKVATVLAVLVSSITFGLAHYQEGPVGIVETFAMGLLFGAVYLGTGRNLWVTIIAHGLANTLRFVFVFAGAA